MKPSFKIDMLKPVSDREERPSSVWHSSLCYPGKTTYGGAMSHNRSYSRSRTHSRIEPYPLRQKVIAKPAGKAIGKSERMMTIMNMLSESQDYSKLPGTSLTQELSDLKHKLGYNKMTSPFEAKKEKTGPPTHKLQFLHNKAEDKRGYFLNSSRDGDTTSPASRPSPTPMFTAGSNIKDNFISGEKKTVTPPPPKFFDIQSSPRKTENRFDIKKTDEKNIFRQKENKNIFQPKEDRNIFQPKPSLKFSFSRPEMASVESEKDVDGLRRSCDNQSFTFSSPITVDEYKKRLHHA